MGIRLVQSGGSVVEPAVLNLRCSGVVYPNSVVELSRTGGAGVNIASSGSTTTNIFGVCLDYKQGASDTEVKVLRFVPGQLFEVDCTDAATTAQIGLRHVLNDGLLVRNTASDLGAGNAHTAVFRAVAMTGATTGSGKLIGYFRLQDAPAPANNTTWS